MSITTATEPRTAAGRFAAALEREDVDAVRADLAHDLAIVTALRRARATLDPTPSGRAAAERRLLDALGARGLPPASSETRHAS